MKKFLSVLKNIARGGLVVADAGAKVGVPVLSQIDAAADSIKSLKVRSKSDREKVAEALAVIEQLRALVPDNVERKAGSALQRILVSKKTTVGGITSILSGLGLLAGPLDGLVNGTLTDVPMAILQVKAAIGFIGIGFVGIFAKDNNVTGGTVRQ
jgi:hypothetical protein